MQKMRRKITFGLRSLERAMQMKQTAKPERMAAGKMEADGSQTTLSPNECAVSPLALSVADSPRFFSAPRAEEK